jgi:hypothetical protein
LETLLLHLRNDSKFNRTRTTNAEPTIVLHARTPEKTGFLMSFQIRSDLRGRALPDGTESHLRRRNTPADAKPDTYEAIAASYTNLTFAAGIVVADLTEVWKQRRSFRSFEEAHSTARGWVEAYLPGYSADGAQAVVRAAIGPSPHGAMLTAVLEKVGSKWIVKWHDIAFYV